MKADLVIVNHSLVLSDFSSDGALFGEISKIVFDEAHHLEDVATDHFGTTISMPVLKGALERVGSVVRRKGELAINASALPNHELVVPILEDTTRTINDLIGKLEPFFSGLRLLVKDVHTDRNYSTPVRYSSSDLLCQAIRAYTGDISDDIGHVVKDLLKLIERIVPFEESYLTPTIVQDVRNGVQDLNECATALEYSLDASREDRVYWVEIPAWANQPVMLKTAPLDVAVLLADSIFQRLDASILTSATLTTGGVSGFHHLQERLGLNLLEEGKFQFAAHGSPFDYNRNCLTLSASFPPHPSETPIDHSNCVAEVCAQLAQELHRGMLVLFTSYESLKRVEKELKRLLFGSDVEVLVQLGRSDRDRLIRRFRSGHGSILLGADSLWEGIDVPGAALEVVVIAKLPFDVPGDPVVSARIDQLRQQQRNPFFDYQLPSAILRTRQGAGRLIRTATDRGVVILLDPRITSKGYGRQIVRALPGRNAQAASIDELSDMASQFFAEESV
jgi:Rad3-related DNA helicase